MCPGLSRGVRNYLLAEEWKRARMMDGAGVLSRGGERADTSRAGIEIRKSFSAFLFTP